MARITIGELLRRHRLAAELTQKQVAEKIPCHHSLVSRVERGILFPSPSYVEHFIEGLALPETERQEIWEVYRHDDQARRHPLTTTESPTDEVQEQIHWDPQVGRWEWIRRWSRYRHTLWSLLLVILALLLAVLLLTPRLRDLSFAAPRPTPTASGHLVVLEPLRLEPPEPVVGQPVTATFQLHNGSDQVVPLVQLVAAARGPGARRLKWDAPHADFPAVSFLICAPAPCTLTPKRAPLPCRVTISSNRHF